MAVSGVLGWHNIRGLKMRIELTDEIYAGLATLATVRLVNAKRFSPSFLLRIKIMGKTVNSDLIKRGAHETNSFVQSFPERGRVAIPFGEICSPFPINFFVRCRRTTLNRQFLVFPAPQCCPAAFGLDKTLKNGDCPSPLKGYEGDVTRIADYTGCEPMKLIHWRLSARHEEFKVKEMNKTSREPVMIDIDSLPGRNLEENLSCAVYLINRLIRRNLPVGLKLQERVINPAISREHRLKLLSELAVYGKD